MNSRTLGSLGNPLVFLVSLVAACGSGSSNGSADASSPVTDAATTADAVVREAGPPVVAGTCDMVVPGTVNGYMVDGNDREFILKIPTGATGPGGHWPVVFNWHGLGDTASNMHRLLSGAVNNSTLPFILVTPESRMLGRSAALPLGIEWDNLKVTAMFNNDLRLFDALLNCIDQNWGVDRDHVHTVGFSAGAIMSDLLADQRSDQIASVITYSGGYFSNAADRALLGGLSSFVGWPAIPSDARYTQMILTGGTTDMFAFGATSIHFDQFAANDTTYLNASGHDVVFCNHGTGHNIPDEVMSDQVVEFFAAHPRTVTHSPWSAGLPSDYPSYCMLRRPITL